MVKTTILRAIRAVPTDVDGWMRLYNDVHPDPLGTGKGLTRFCHPDFDFTVLYMTPRLQTAFVEVLVRGCHDGRDEAVITEDELEAVRIASISSRAPLQLVDLTGSAMVAQRLHSGIVGNTDQRAGRAFARDLYTERPDIDGILYPSRLVHDEICVAVYDRAVAKLSAVKGKTLNEDARMPAILQNLNIVRGAVDPDACDDED